MVLINGDFQRLQRPSINGMAKRNDWKRGNDSECGSNENGMGERDDSANGSHSSSQIRFAGVLHNAWPGAFSILFFSDGFSSTVIFFYPSVL